jgi:L-asparaginase/Glu-tRNA(Gln) amidotransferase subunit D
MARAAGSERRLLAVYTGGTIGMRSEDGGESVTPRPVRGGFRAWL